MMTIGARCTFDAHKNLSFLKVNEIWSRTQCNRFFCIASSISFWKTTKFFGCFCSISVLFDWVGQEMRREQGLISRNVVQKEWCLRHCVCSLGCCSGDIGGMPVRSSFRPNTSNKYKSVCDHEQSLWWLARFGAGGAAHWLVFRLEVEMGEMRRTQPDRRVAFAGICMCFCGQGRCGGLCVHA